MQNVKLKQISYIPHNYKLKKFYLGHLVKITHSNNWHYHNTSNDFTYNDFTLMTILDMGDITCHYITYNWILLTNDFTYNSKQKNKYAMSHLLMLYVKS